MGDLGASNLVNCQRNQGNQQIAPNRVGNFGHNLLLYGKVNS